MAISRHVGRLGRLGQTLRPSALSFSNAGSVPRPWVCKTASESASVRWIAQGQNPKQPADLEQEDGQPKGSIKPSYTSSFIRHDVLPVRENFAQRHIGPDDQSTEQMLASLTPPAASLDEFVRQVIPADILSSRSLFPLRRDRFGATASMAVHEGHQEWEVMEIGRNLAAQNHYGQASFIGQGYYGTHVPEVIKRNVLQSPGWYTSYTPYQPEISQGRLESLLNFQTMVSDLTGLPVSNASLLDEGTAAAEAMTMSLNALPASRLRGGGRKVFVTSRLFPQTSSVLHGRAEGFGVEILEMNFSDQDAFQRLQELGDSLVGVMVQYPDRYGRLHDYRKLAEAVHKQGALLSVATDLLALTMLTPPGEFGADIAFGTSQRFGVPMGLGGPHAAFFAVSEKHKRKMPGRLIGVSKDRNGGRALRLSLQTREQHIRREKATSNVCTAQALLANMSAFYAVYHGPDGLKAIAERVHRAAQIVQAAAHHYISRGPQPAPFFDTVFITAPKEARTYVREAATSWKMNFNLVNEDAFTISVDETTDATSLYQIVAFFRAMAMKHTRINETAPPADEMLERFVSELGHTSIIPNVLQRRSKFLTHPVFNTHHSETELLRYIHHLQSKDLSLVHSMIPLGSCTMKLNASTEMALITLPGFSNLHPFVPAPQMRGYENLVSALNEQLMDITGMDGVSLQPNSGAQGEFAGLRAIRRYHQDLGQHNRDICLIPVSAHGTNPASAAMAGMRVVPVKCDVKTGNLDLADLKAKCEQHAENLGAMMITYPSTFGVFEPKIKQVCEIVHMYGGQVYMDGANMNAQIGLCSPGEIGADVCHLNLHKTFCIPHGGGGPGVGPICVKQHLVPFLPGGKTRAQRHSNYPVSSAMYGSAGILPISWAYNAMMGAEGLKKATQITLLNANYLLSLLKPHYPILYTNEFGRCAHEFILDVRPFHNTAGIEAIDIAKRLQDYGFHAPTMSWPVPNTLMIEPTESESKEELDRFAEALISIREEIREIEEGKVPRQGNVLKMSPHPIQDIIEGDGDSGAKWDRPYTRQKAAYPLPWLKEKKFWPSVARLDDSKFFLFGFRIYEVLTLPCSLW